MDRAAFDAIVLPRLLRQVEVDDSILEYGFSPAELDTVIWGCPLPAAGSAAAQLPDLRKLFDSLEMSIDDRSFEGDFWAALPSSDPELTPWLRGKFQGHQFYVIFRPSEAFGPGTSFDLDVVCHDDLRALRSGGASVVEHTHGWCCACVALAKVLAAREVELEVMDRQPDMRLVIWEKE